MYILSSFKSDSGEDQRGGRVAEETNLLQRQKAASDATQPGQKEEKKMNTHTHIHTYIHKYLVDVGMH